MWKKEESARTGPPPKKGRPRGSLHLPPKHQECLPSSRDRSIQSLVVETKRYFNLLLDSPPLPPSFSPGPPTTRVRPSCELEPKATIPATRENSKQELTALWIPYGESHVLGVRRSNFSARPDVLERGRGSLKPGAPSQASAGT
jgi:hypothetical protein